MAEIPLKQYMGNVETLQNLLLPSSALDAVFVAVDFEGTRSVIKGFRNVFLQDAQVGLAILDTRDLNSTSKITTVNFITGSDAYFEEVAPGYQWGTAEKIPCGSMLSKINDCLHMYRDRNIVLVGHDISNDLKALKALGFDFGQIIETMDTYFLAIHLLMGDFSLKNLLKEFHCKFNFHNAGNDANATLRALLFLGIKAIGQTESSIILDRVEMIRQIAMEGVLSETEEINATKSWNTGRTKEMREQRRRKREGLGLDLYFNR